MRPSSQCHKQQRNSGSRAKSKPMLVNREQKPSEKPPAKNCTKCKESANYFKIFVKRLGTIEELASGSTEFKTVNKNNFASCTLAELGQLLDLTTKVIRAGTSKLASTSQSTENSTPIPLPVLEDTPCKSEPEDQKLIGLPTPQASPTTTPSPGSPADNEGKRSREEGGDCADEEKIQKRVRICISDVITAEPADLENELDDSTPLPPDKSRNERYRHDSGCFVGSDTEGTQKEDSKLCDTNDDNPKTSACLSNTPTESNFVEEMSLKSTAG